MDLQSTDLQIQQLENKMAEGAGDLDARKAAIKQYRQDIIEYTERYDTGEKRQRELEGMLEDGITRLKDRQAKQMNIQNDREYHSILKEIEDTKQQNKQREDELVLLVEQTESIKAKINELENLCASEENALQEEIGKVASVAKDLESKKEKIQKTRDKQAKKVDSKFLKRYEMLRERRNGLALAAVTKGVCRGCNMNIPPQLFNNLLKDEEILSCPTCNRMMYHAPEQEVPGQDQEN
jgi:hypothetical protein